MHKKIHILSIFCLLHFFIYVDILSQNVQDRSINIRLKKGSSKQQLIHALDSLTLPIFEQYTLQSFVPTAIIDQEYISSQALYMKSRAFDNILRTYSCTFKQSISPIFICDYLKKHIDIIDIAEPRYLEFTQYTPNDANIHLQSFYETVKAFSAWDSYQGDTSIVIAIVDNGFQQNHIDLKDNIAINWKEIENNEIDDDKNGIVDDYKGANMAWPNDGSQAGSTYNSTDGHGTMVAGVAAATWNNSIGIAGAAAKCRFFPIKAGKEGSDRVEYGYESILYAVLRGFHIINCSWGSANSYSEINQSIIDFACEQEVLIIASGGNDRNRAPFYPAGYKGVLGVGETDLSDAKTNGSSYGWHIGIMAPGYMVQTTDNDINSYTVASGTSFASPIISACAALVKGKYPDASMQMIHKHVQQTSDNISLSNTLYPGMIPGRVNFKKALDYHPNTFPIISIKDWNIYNANGTRFKVGDTIFLKLSLDNVFTWGAQNISVKISSLTDFFEPVHIIDSVINIDRIPPYSSIIIDSIRIAIKESSDASFLLKADISSENEVFPSTLIPYRPIPSITTFHTDNLSFSLGDYGSLGFTGDRTIGNTGNESFDGLGFIIKNIGSILYSGGIIANSGDKILKGFASESNFEPTKRFENNSIGSTMILSDSLNPDYLKIGLTVKQTISSLKSNAITIKYTLYNSQDQPIANPGLALYADWDIGNYGRENRVELFTESIPEELRMRAQAEIAYREGTYNNKPYPFIGMVTIASGKESSFFPQSAGINSAIFEGLDADFAGLFNSNSSVQFPSKGDISIFSGGSFKKVLSKGDSAEFYIIFAADTLKNNVGQIIRNTINEIEYISSVNNDSNTIKYSDARYIDFVNLDNEISKFSNFYSVEIFNLQGERVLISLDSTHSIQDELAVCTSGIYQVIITDKKCNKVSVTMSCVK